MMLFEPSPDRNGAAASDGAAKPASRSRAKRANRRAPAAR
jgi:hypothetical protein